MKREPVLDRGAGGQLSGSSGWFALTPAAQILPRGHRLRHATVELSDATGQSSRPPDDLEDATGRSENAPDGLENAPGRSSRHPGRLSRSPGELEHAPADSERPPSEPEGSGAARREGMDGARRPGAARRGGAVFVPEGRRGVATGGAMGRRPERNPWTGREKTRTAPAGRRSFAGCVSAPVDAPFLCPSGAEENTNDALHGLRSLEDSLTSPVATALDPSGVERRGGWRGLDPHARAGGIRFRSGEVPEGRHAPLASAHPHAGGSGVRRGF